MRQPHPNTHLVETVIKILQKGDHVGGITVGLIHNKFVNDYPQAEIPSPRTIATIKKRLETPEPPPSNLCKGCMGYGYLYEQTRRYFCDGTEFTAPNRPHIEVTCHICENSGIDPSWQRPVSVLLAKMGVTPSEIKDALPKATESISLESLEKTL